MHKLEINGNIFEVELLTNNITLLNQNVRFWRVMRHNKDFGFYGRVQDVKIIQQVKEALFNRLGIIPDLFIGLRRGFN